MPSLNESPEYQALRRYIELSLEMREVKARLDELIALTKAMAPSLLAWLAAAGMKNVGLNGVTVFPRRKPWAYPMQGVTRSQVCEALKLAGFRNMVKENYSTESLTSLIKQLEEKKKTTLGLDPFLSQREVLIELGLHPALAAVINVVPQYSLVVMETEKDPLYEQQTQYQNERTEGDRNDDDF
jgi:hypothetical protein